MSEKVLFVTGTDTDVGKTVIATGLMAAAEKSGLKTAAIKPVAAGCEETEDGLQNSDALLLQAAATEQLPYQQVNPVALQPAIAPHIAAQKVDKRFSVSRLVGFCRGVAMLPVNLVIIEGAGGWRVPLNERETLAGLPKELNCGVIMVIGMRLGCLNHAILTAEAIQRDGLQLVGWIANILDPEMPELDANIESLKRFLHAPCLGVVPKLDNPSAENVSQYLSLPDSNVG